MKKEKTKGTNTTSKRGVTVQETPNDDLMKKSVDKNVITSNLKKEINSEKLKTNDHKIEVKDGDLKTITRKNKRTLKAMVDSFGPDLH